MNWGFLQASQLGWLALAPLVIFFYLMKRTRRERPVPALFLWQKASSQARVDSFWQRLRNSLFLWLQLLLLILMALALARPYHLQPGHLPRQVALILDQSASMGARIDGSTRFELAQKKARELIMQASAGTEFLLAGMPQRPRIYYPFSRDREKLLKALNKMRWEAVESEPSSLLPLALSLTRSNQGCEVILIGDKNLESAAVRFVDCRTSGGARNLAVTAFQVEEDEQGELRAFAHLRSYSDQAETVPYSLLDEHGHILLTRTVLLASRGECSLNLDVPKVNGPFQLRLELDDDLAVDNSAWSLPAPKRRIGIVVKGSISPFLRQALLAQEEVTLTSGDDSPQVAPPSGISCWAWAQPGDAPAKLPPGNHIMGSPPSKSGAGTLTAAPKGPLGQFPLGELWVSGLTPILYQSWSGDVLLPTPWLLCGDESALLQLKGPHHNILAFGFSLDDSNLPLNPALPLILARFLETLPGSGLGQAPSQARCGQELSWSVSRAIELDGPEGMRWRLEPVRERVDFTPTQPGVYRVAPVEGSGATFVASFSSEQESNLLARPPGAPQPQVESGEIAPVPSSSGQFAREYWRWGVAAVICLSLLEWWLFWRPR